MARPLALPGPVQRYDGGCHSAAQPGSGQASQRASGPTASQSAGQPTGHIDVRSTSTTPPPRRDEPVRTRRRGLPGPPAHTTTSPQVRAPGWIPHDGPGVGRRPAGLCLHDDPGTRAQIRWSDPASCSGGSRRTLCRYLNASTPCPPSRSSLIRRTTPARTNRRLVTFGSWELRPKTLGHLAVVRRQDGALIGHCCGLTQLVEDSAASTTGMRKGWFGDTPAPADTTLIFECDLGWTFDPAPAARGSRPKPSVGCATTRATSAGGVRCLCDPVAEYPLPTGRRTIGCASRPPDRTARHCMGPL
jgi:hypothetical protein